MRVPLLLALALLVTLLAIPVSAETAGPGSPVAWYFTGNGCPHCAKVNPVLFGEWLGEYPGLVVVEYEVYGSPENAAVMAGMNRDYGIGLGIPVLFFSRNSSFAGDTRILSGVPGFLNETFAGQAPPSGLTPLGSLDIGRLPGYPRVWKDDRVLVREGAGGDTAVLRAILSGGDPAAVIPGGAYQDLGPQEIDHGDLKLLYEHTLRVDGWLFAWNGEAGTGLTPTATGTPEPTTAVPTGTATSGVTTVPTTVSVTPGPTGTCPQPGPEFTAGQIMALAAVNAINPCALAVLVVILLAIITNNPGRREQVLLAGLAFSLSIFVFYLLYGILLVSLLSAVRELTALAALLTRALGVVSIAIGLFHIREYYSPGRDAVLTGIPSGWKPRLGQLLNGITTPLGGFIVGALVTLFLLPCNIAPYIIGCGILSVYGPLVAIPYLLLYNLVFILPMLAITAIVYLGVARIGDVKGWREKNIGRFHLASGIIILAFGILLVTGLI